VGTVRAGIVIFSMKKESKSSLWNRIFFVHHRIVSEFERVEFVSVRVSYIMLGGRWCNIVLNVHAPSEDKSGHAKDSLCEELEQVFYHFPKYHLEILLGFFNTKVGR